MRTVLAIIGMIGAFFMMKYRERVGDMLGEADWMTKVGGVYNVIVILSVLLFFWCLAELTGTTEVLFRPILRILPLPGNQ